MAIEIRHKFVSPKQDGDDNTLVQPSNWNDDHNITLSQDKIIGRASSGYGAAEEITCTAAGRALLDDNTAAEQRETLGLGSIATQSANNVNITGGSISGITDLAIADGGTGASTPVAARENLKIKTLDQETYDALDPPDPDTLYFITDAS